MHEANGGLKSLIKAGSKRGLQRIQAVNAALERPPGNGCKLLGVGGLDCGSRCLRQTPFHRQPPAHAFFLSIVKR
jgi:hypothetical protein